MILILLGTQDKSFHRLLDEIERLIDKKVIKDKVVAQIGYTEFSSDNIEIHDFLTHDELVKLEVAAKYIICHAGVGTIMENLALNKKIVVVPRLKKYKEHTNDHQLQILNTFAKNGYVIDCIDVRSLEKAIKKIPKFKPKKLEDHSNKKMLNVIENFISNI